VSIIGDHKTTPYMHDKNSSALGNYGSIIINGCSVRAQYTKHA